MSDHKSKEKVLIIHEDEAAMLYKAVRQAISSNDWNLLDDEMWCEVNCLKALDEKLQVYLDEGTGRDVIEVDSK